MSGLKSTVVNGLGWSRGCPKKRVPVFIFSGLYRGATGELAALAGKVAAVTETDFKCDLRRFLWQGARFYGSWICAESWQRMISNELNAAYHVSVKSARKPGFIMVNCNGWGMTPTDIKWVADQLGSEYEILRPDVFAKTYLKIYGYPY